MRKKFQQMENTSEYNRDYRIAELIARQLVGVLTEKEQEELEEWQMEHKEVLRRISDHKELRLRNRYVESLEVGRAWSKIQTGIKPVAKKQSHPIRWWHLAACIGLVFGIGILYFHKYQERPETGQPMAMITAGSSKAVLITSTGRQIVLQDSLLKEISTDEGILVYNDGQKAEYNLVDYPVPVEKEVKFNTIIVPRGGEYQLRLSDGTRVWLNSDSEIRFPVQFYGKLRQVELKGEAFFEVAHDSLHPFIVNVYDKMEVKVLGTEFNIQAYPGDQVVKTTLNQGKVEVVTGDESVKLKSDQQAVWEINSPVMKLKQVKAAQYSAWKDGKLIFEDEKLEVILNRLARWYDITVFYQDNECKDFHFTGDLEKYEDFSMTLSMLEKSTNIHFEVRDRTVVVRRRV